MRFISRGRAERDSIELSPFHALGLSGPCLGQELTMRLPASGPVCDVDASLVSEYAFL
jgi:hypothetical protein